MVIKGTKNLYMTYAKHSVCGGNTEEMTRGWFQSLQEQEERKNTERTAPVSPPQLRMLCLSSAATYMQQFLPHLGERGKAGFFNFAIHHIFIPMT